MGLRRGAGEILAPWRRFLSYSAEPAVVVQEAFDWALWIIPMVKKFPKYYRFSIGQSPAAASGWLGRRCGK